MWHNIGMDRVLVLIGMLLIGYGFAPTIEAQSLSSPSYSIDESYIGPGGAVDSNSASYSSNSTVGDVGVGNSSSTSYQQDSGFNTTADPRLSVIINTSSVGFGSLSTSVAATQTSTFSVLNYTSYGYAVYTVGNPPSNGSHTLTGINPRTASNVGTEQFGINLKANTSPTTFGAEAVQNPSSNFSNGFASSGYDSANLFRYVAGEKIAEATQSSGQTDYTISYIINVATNTPGGQYSGSQSIVVVATY